MNFTLLLLCITAAIVVLCFVGAMACLSNDPRSDQRRHRRLAAYIITLAVCLVLFIVYCIEITVENL